MTPVHLHLLVIHLPLAGTLLGLVLLLASLVRRKEAGMAQAAALVLVLSGAGAVVAEESGEGAEHTVEELPGVEESFIEAHEEAAELAVPVAVVTGLLALGSAAARTLRPGAGWAMGVSALALVGNLASAGAMVRVGQTGGRIRHPEVRDGASAPAAERGPEREEHAD
jgi:hypothetical protein